MEWLEWQFQGHQYEHDPKCTLEHGAVGLLYLVERMASGWPEEEARTIVVDRIKKMCREAVLFEGTYNTFSWYAPEFRSKQMQEMLVATGLYTKSQANSQVKTWRKEKAKEAQGRRVW
jgi:hypothetical protein